MNVISSFDTVAETQIFSNTTHPTKYISFLFSLTVFDLHATQICESRTNKRISISQMDDINNPMYNKQLHCNLLHVFNTRAVNNSCKLFLNLLRRFLTTKVSNDIKKLHLT